MADQQQTPKSPTPNTANASGGPSKGGAGPTPVSTGAGTGATSSSPGSQAQSGATSPSPGSQAQPGATPRPTVRQTGDGYPKVDTLSFDPEDGDWVTSTKRWIEQNPMLAIAGAAAAGLLIGRLVAAAIPDPEPETFGEKVEKRARQLAKQGSYAAADASEVASQQLAVAAEALGEASKAVAQGAKKGYDEAKDFGEFLAETVGQAVATKASKWLDKR
jgi:hypothetical protein